MGTSATTGKTPKASGIGSGILRSDWMGATLDDIVARAAVIDLSLSVKTAMASITEGRENGCA
jgi:hypothetical protein